MVRVVVDENACIGSGECVSTDPDAVALDDSGCAYMLVSELAEDRAKRLCDSCPVGALSIA